MPLEIPGGFISILKVELWDMARISHSKTDEKYATIQNILWDIARVFSLVVD